MSEPVVSPPPPWLQKHVLQPSAGTGPDVWGTGPIQGATLPDRFYVDYVRLWKYEAP